MVKRVFILFFALSFTVLTIFSCSQNKGSIGDQSLSTGELSDSNEGESLQETERLKPNLPDKKFENYNFRFYSWNIDGWRVYNDIFVEDPTDLDSISQKVYDRNSKIEEQYEIVITEKREFYSKYSYMIQQNTSTGDDYADVLISHGWIIPSLYGFNVFYNLKDVKYLEFDMPWWDNNATEALTIEGFLPTGVSDLTLLDKSATYVVFYNRTLGKELSINDNLYDDVNNYDWTQDKLRVIGKKGSKDMNGDGEIKDYGVDRFGIIGNDSAVTALFGGSGGKYVDLDNEGVPYISFPTDRNFECFQYFLTKILFDETLYCNTSWVEGFTDPDSLAKLFSDDLGLFYIRVLEEGEKLRRMESEYSILPIPMYEDSQKRYYCPVSVFSNNLISVPIHAEDTERTGIIIEALSAESHYSVNPEFYNKVLDYKIARDEKSQEMLDIIFNSRLYDLGEFYGLGYFADKMRGITGHSYSITGISQTSDIVSYYETYRAPLEADLEKLIGIVDQWNS